MLHHIVLHEYSIVTEEPVVRVALMEYCDIVREEGGRWLTGPAACVLGSALSGTAVLLAALAYWGLFPILY